MHDAHIHSNYSDGEFLRSMIEAAEDTELDAVGFADHCFVTERQTFADRRAVVGLNLDRTHDRRRQAIEMLREESPLTIYDTVEMDYDPRDEAEIGSFLEAANFDYVVGSVHFVGDVNVQVERNFEGASDAERDRIVDRYYDQLVTMIETELFDIVAHPDLPERTGPLRGRATKEQYHSVARALEQSRTVPEINAGRALMDSGVVHPTDTFLDVLAEYDIEFTVGSDSHKPEQIGKRHEFLSELLVERDIEPIPPTEIPGVETTVGN